MNDFFHLKKYFGDLKDEIIQFWKNYFQNQSGKVYIFLCRAYQDYFEYSIVSDIRVCCPLDFNLSDLINSSMVVIGVWISWALLWRWLGRACFSLKEVELWALRVLGGGIGAASVDSSWGAALDLVCILNSNPKTGTTTVFRVDYQQEL